MGLDLGIDLGTANVLVYSKKNGIILHEPSVVAMDAQTEQIVAVGEDAKEMLGRSADGLKIIRPLRKGVVADYTVTEVMLKHFIRKIFKPRLFAKRPRIAVCVPSSVTSIERKAVEDATIEAGAREVYILEEPLAAAIGSGIDVTKPCGIMVIDIGGGTTDIAVISLAESVVSDSVRVAGDDFDEAIINYVRKEYNVLIGERTAEYIKIQIGTVVPNSENYTMTVKGRSLVDGRPQVIEISSYNVYRALNDSIETILETVIGVLEKTSPELVSDIVDYGILLTGGGSLLNGLDYRISQSVGATVYVSENPLECVAIGAGRFFDIIDDPNFKMGYKLKMNSQSYKR